MVAMELMVLRQSFAKHYGGGGGVGGAAPGMWYGCPPTPSLYIGGRGEGAPARRNPRLVWAPPPPRKLAPQAGRGGCPRGGAPTSPGYVRWGGRGAEPLSGLMCPLPLAIRPPNACRGLRNPFRTRWSSPGTPGTIPDSNTLHPIY